MSLMRMRWLEGYDHLEGVVVEDVCECCHHNPSKDSVVLAHFQRKLQVLKGVALKWLIP